MVTCGHQFQLRDQCDWFISSSAVHPLNGDTSSTKILQNLIEAHCTPRAEESRNVFGELRENKSDSDKSYLAHYLQSGCSEGSHSVAEELDVRKAPALLLEAREIQLTTPSRKKATVNRTAVEDHAINPSDSDDFEENQHVDDCPIKWYCRRRTKKGWGPCVALRRHVEDTVSHTGKKYRDRIPLEVNIGKISLNKREHDVRDFRKVDEQNETEKYRKIEIDPKVAELQKKKLEAKLNWRPFQENDEREESELSNDLSPRVGYLRPRSVLGGKAPVSILLFPYHQRSNCSCGRSADEAPQTRGKRVSSANQTPNPSPPIEAPSSEKILRPKTAQSLKRSSKSQRKGKTLQLPKQTNVSFEVPKSHLSKRGSNLPGISKRGEKAVRPIKRSGEEVGNVRSLTSLYYELEDKSNSGRMIDDESLEKMIQELSMGDNLRGLRNIFNPGFPVKKKRFREECHHHLTRWPDDEHFKIICKKIKFAQRRPKSNISHCDQTEISDLILNRL